MRWVLEPRDVHDEHAIGGLVVGSDRREMPGARLPEHRPVVVEDEKARDELALAAASKDQLAKCVQRDIDASCDRCLHAIAPREASKLFEVDPVLPMTKQAAEDPRISEVSEIV